MTSVRQKCQKPSVAALILLSTLLLIQGGCHERTESLAQQRLHEWLPQSAREVVSRSTGGQDDTTFITFVCSESDLNSLRSTFAKTKRASWGRPPFDRRTTDILKLATRSLNIDTAMLPSVSSADVEYLILPESDPYLPVGLAVVLDAGKNRVWYIQSSM